ncbi:MAG TPA: circularly permuted type 2 ATP-grasp protein [Aldersonia sp.]
MTQDAAGLSFRPEPPADLMQAYRSAGRQPVLFDASGDRPTPRYDELIAPDGTVRPAWSGLADEIVAQGAPALRRLAGRVARLVDDDGITYNPVSAVHGAAGTPVAWRLDPVPILVGADDWEVLEAGLEQRANLLDAVLEDLYGPMETVRRGLIPPEVVFGHPGYLRAAYGVPMPERFKLFMHGCDLSRWSDGQFRVSDDWTQAPSGAGYALAGRRVMARAIPEVFEHAGPRPLTPFARTLRAALIEAAPETAENPTVVVLSPGTHSETAFDQAHLASILGFPLVESADLVVRDGKLWMRSLGKLERVDVVLRRVDAEFVDPLDLRPDSRLGVVGLVEVMRRGAVSVVNGLGSRVLENPALPALLPALSRALLDEDLQLDSAPRYWGGDPAQRSHLLVELDQLLIRSTTGGQTIDGRTLTAARRSDLAKRVGAEGWKWVGQQPTEYSDSPAALEHGAFVAAPVGFRTFAIAQGTGYTTMVGGLGEVLAHDADGVGLRDYAAKDVWVRVADRAARAETISVRIAEETLPAFEAPEIDVVSSPRVLADLFWMGRYAERAEDTARLLIAARERYQDYRYSPYLEGRECVPVLMNALGALTGSDVGAVEQAQVHLDALTGDPNRPGSLAESIDRLGYSARAVRDQLSVDTWVVLGAVERAIVAYANSPARNESGMATVHSVVVSGMLAMSGLGAESMVHDTGWYVMDIGKRIERATGLTALLRATLTRVHPFDAEPIITEAVLAASESSVIYRRRNKGPTRIAAVAQLLLFDDGNPRSLVFQLDALRRDLRALPDASGSSRTERVVEEMVARLRRVDPPDLENVDENGERSEFAELLDATQQSLRTLSDVFTETRLSLPGEIQQLWGPEQVRTMP